MSGLVLERVFHAFGANEVVCDVSLAVAGGELACLVGPSGCGKTTLLRMAAGLEHLQHGRIEVGGKAMAGGVDGREVPPEGRGIGLVFQDHALFPHLTILDNVLFGVRLERAPRRAWAEAALVRMGLEAYADSYPHILSGGQQQRVALLRALAPEPRVLLLDEPFSDLDATRRSEIREETRQLLKETAVATLMVTHDPEEAMFMADRILVMQLGRLLQDGTPADVYFHPASPFVATLFGPANRFEARIAGGLAETPLGCFRAPDLKDGVLVEVLIRPEGLRPAAEAHGTGLSTDIGIAGDPEEDGCGVGPLTARVVWARLLGRSSLLSVQARGPGGAEVPLQARVPGAFLPEAGAEVTLAVDPRHVFVFEAG